MDNKSKTELSFPSKEEWDQIRCSVCNSPFHKSEECPNTGASKFHTRKEMKLKKGSLPFKFQVDIDSQDDETEIIRKRSLLRLNSSKVYNLMGLSVKAHESQKATLQWLLRLADELDIDDEVTQKERAELLPIIKTLQDVFQQLTHIRQIKIKQAETMEEVVSRARNEARRVRTQIHNEKVKNKEFGILEFTKLEEAPLIYDSVNPTQLIKDTATAIIEKEKSKQQKDKD